MAGSIMSKGNATVLLLVLLVACANLPHMQATIDCGVVSSKLSPCLSYLEAAAISPSSGCCNGVNALYSATEHSKPDRVTACGCIKKLSAALGSKLNVANVGALPGECGVKLGYTPSPSTVCSKIP